MRPGEAAVEIDPATPPDLAAAAALLSGAGVTLAGIEAVAEAGTLFVARSADGSILGCAGLERYGPAVLLRSVAVARRARGSGLGRALVAAALEHARDGGAREAWLLTETAAAFFAALGWERCERTQAPPAIAGSVEFATACPASATAMRRAL